MTITTGTQTAGCHTRTRST